jgi:hypothetical protein
MTFHLRLGLPNGTLPLRFQIKIVYISGSHGGKHEDDESLLGYYAV